MIRLIKWNLSWFYDVCFSFNLICCNMHLWNYFGWKYFRIIRLVFWSNFLNISICLTLAGDRRRKMNRAPVINKHDRWIEMILAYFLKFNWLLLETCCKLCFSLMMLWRALDFKLFLHSFNDNSVCLDPVYCCLSLIFNFDQVYGLI